MYLSRFSKVYLSFSSCAEQSKPIHHFSIITATHTINENDICFQIGIIRIDLGNINNYRYNLHLIPE